MFLKTIYRPYAFGENGQSGRCGALCRGRRARSLEHERAHWASLVKEVRQSFDGLITYAASGTILEPDFWDLVDEIGISSYFELSLSGPSQERVGQATRQWHDFLHKVSAYSKAINRPLLLVEVGYPSQVSAARWPWDETRHDKIDLNLQADLYTAFCDAMAVPHDGLTGFFFWNWFGFGGSNDNDSYTPRGKPAARSDETLFAQHW